MDSSGCNCLLSSRTLRRQNLLLGQDREWNQQTHEGVGRHHNRHQIQRCLHSVLCEFQNNRRTTGEQQNNNKNNRRRTTTRTTGGRTTTRTTGGRTTTRTTGGRTTTRTTGGRTTTRTTGGRTTTGEQQQENNNRRTTTGEQQRQQNNNDNRTTTTEEQRQQQNNDNHRTTTTTEQQQNNTTTTEQQQQPTVHLCLCRLQVSIRFANLSNLCVVVLCDASSHFIFTLELAKTFLASGISALFSNFFASWSSQRHAIISFAITDIVFLAMMVRTSSPLATWHGYFVSDHRKALDVVIFVSIRVFALLSIESHCVLLYYVYTLEKKHVAHANHSQLPRNPTPFIMRWLISCPSDNTTLAC